MDWLLYIALAGTLAVGLFLNILGLPGLWLMVAAHAAYAWATGWQLAFWPSLLALLLLALAAEVAEFAAGAAGSKSAGGTIRSMLGAIAGVAMTIVAWRRRLWSLRMGISAGESDHPR